MKTDDTLVSIVIPSYNHASFIGEAIASVAAQEDVPLELIVVDDGSRDGSPEVIERALAKFARGRCELVVQPNRGAHEAINRGMALARGGYVQILNSDDRFRPQRLKLLLSAIEKTDASLAFSDLRVIDDRGDVLPPLHPKVVWYRNARETMLAEPSIGFGLLRINAAVTTSNFLFRRELLRRVEGFTAERLCHDWRFLLRTLPFAEPLHVAEPLLDYRLHGTNTVNRVLDLGRVEGEPALREYFLAVAERPPENRHAPCAYWWPGFFPVFAATRAPWFAAEPMARFLPGLASLAPALP